MTFSTVKKDLDFDDYYNERLEDAIKAFAIIEMNDALDPSPPAIEVVSFLNATIDLPKNDKFTSHHLGGNLYEISFNPIKKYTEGGSSVQDERGLWQLTKEGASEIKNHKTFGTIYKSKSDGLWWAVDKAGHGGSKFKVFKETNKGLEWFKDADEFGDFIINKHKGSTGTFIPWGQLSTVK